MTDTHLAFAYKYFKPIQNNNEVIKERVYQLEQEMFRRQIEAL